MQTEDYSIDQRVYRSFNKNGLFEALSEHKNYLFELNYLALMGLEGAQVAQFLQGQLSCDINEVNEHTMRQGILCNLKGRVMALLDVFYWQDYFLLMPKDLMQLTAELLAKTALVSRVHLKPAPEFNVYGFLMSRRSDIQPFEQTMPQDVGSLTGHQDFCCYALGDQLYIIVVKADKAKELAEPFVQKEQFLGEAEWHALQIGRLRAEIYPSTRALFLPHRLNLHKHNYISFNKGCYKGQEIIARTHYLAKLKHELALFWVQKPSIALIPGMKLFSGDPPREVGELIDFCPKEQDQALILASVLKDHPGEVLFEGASSPTILNNPPKNAS